jgi:hypothetical protein
MDMKKYKHTLISGLLFLAFALVFASCDYQKIADGDYPDQTIYMPAANYYPFLINELPKTYGSTPTPGNPERFKVDLQGKKFNVLLGVYRSGVDEKGSFNVNVAVNTDTIAKLLAAGNVLPAGTELLPADKYTVPASVALNDGDLIGKFDLVVDLDFLINGHPDKKYALGISISSSERQVNKKLATTIVVIDTKIMKPTASFTYKATTTNAKEITFTNTSQAGLTYSWNFGDNSAASTVVAPVHTYAASGSYPVTLTVIGITGENQKSSFSSTIVIP